jgi:colicin import membrane protein
MAGPTPPPLPPDHPRDPVRHPPSADSLRIGTAVALVAHAGLIAALAFGVAWKRQEIATVSAELWAAVPQQAAPAPKAEAPPAAPPPEPAAKVAPPPPPAPTPKVTEPPPAPRDADIAREKADKRRREAEEAERQAEKQAEKQIKLDKAEKAAKEKAEQKEAERKAAEKAEAKAAEKAAEKAAAAEKAEKAKEAAQQEKAAKSREDNLKRLQKQLGEGSDAPAPVPGTAPGTGAAAQSSGPSAGYAGRLRAYLKPKLVYTGRNIGSSPAVVRVRVAPDGTILARELIKSSGQADWDQAVLDAIDRAGILPRDTDSRVPPVIDIPWTASER